MSQVIRKYNPGGKTEKPKLFSVSGLGDFDQASLIERGYRDVDKYISQKGLKGGVASNFRNAVQYMLEGINNGTLTMDAMGNYKDSTGQASSTGELDRKKFFGIKTGLKDTDNNAYGIAADYIHGLVMNAPKYKQSEEKKTAKSWDFKTKLANAALGGNWSEEGWNQLDYDPVTKKWTRTNRIKYINQVLADRLKYLEENPEFDYDEDVFSGREDYLSRFRNAVNALQDGSYDTQDYATLARLGLTDIDKYLKTDFSTPPPPTSPIQGRTGKIDDSWNNSDYERTIDDKGVYHVHKKGSGEEVRGIIPGNPLEGVGNRYAFDGNIYDDSNLPEQYRQDISRARQAQLSDYTSLTDNNPFTKMLRGRGYNYITNLSQFASGIGNNTLYGAYSNPSNTSGKIGFYLKNPTTGKTTGGSVELNKSLGEYQFIGEDGSVINLGAYNPNGARERQGTQFVDYTDTSKENLENLFNTWMQDENLSNPASEAYRMVQNTLSKWIDSGKSPFVQYNGSYKWDVGDNAMNVTRDANGKLSWYFNNKANNDKAEVTDELQRLLSIPVSQRTRQINDRILQLQGYKNGGVISAQLGTKFIESTTPLKVAAVQPDEEQIERNRKARQSFTGRSNVALGDNKDITNAGGVIKTSDKVRLGAAMADLASIGLGFVPGANIASAGIGAGASATEFFADWASDGLDWGDVGRLGMNLGMDALSLIPAGKALKATKALGMIKKSIPVIMTLVNTVPYLDPAIRSEYSKTLSKLTKGDIKSLNTGDFKNLSAIASTVLMGKNVAQAHKGWWNSSITPSGKRRVTAMIDGKQQSLEVDDAFFQNTKGKDQVSQLKTKFAEQYNKTNKLEGDKAIKPENVAIDTKYFGRRPQSEKVEGTQEDGNWLSKSWVGKHFLQYRDPSIVRGNKNIPFSDAWFLGKSPTTQVTTSRNTVSKPKNGKTTALVPVSGKRNEFKEYNDEVQGYERTWRQKEADRVHQNRLKIDDSKYYGDGTVPSEVSTSNFEGVNAEQLRLANRVAVALNSAADAAKSLKPRKNLPAVISTSTNLKDYTEGARARAALESNTIPPTQRLDQFIEGQIPGGRQFGRQRAKTEREYRDVFYPAAEREQNALWSNFAATRQHDVNQRKVVEAEVARAQQRRDSEDVLNSIRKQMALTAARMKPTEISPKEHSKRQKELNEAFIPEYIRSLDKAVERKLPHKKSNKKKKTSKDTRVKRREWGGMIFKDGGLIPKYDGGNVMQRGTKGSWLNNENTYRDATNLGTWDNYYDMNKIVDDVNTSGLLSGQNADTFISTLNGLSSQNLPWKKQLNARGYNNWNQLYKTTGFNKYFGEDEGRFDYLGPSTWNRRLFLQTLENKYNSPDNTLSVGNDNIWYDNGTWRKILNDPELDKGLAVQRTPNALAKTIPVPTAKTSLTERRATLPDKTPRRWSIYPEEAMALGRMIGGLVTNNRAARLYKEGLKPTLLETFENIVPLQGNFQAKTSAEQQAGNLESVAHRPRTSDASLQLAGELEASDKAGQARFQGSLQDAEMFYKTRMLGQQESDAAKARRVDIANKNRVSMNAIDAAKKQIDAGRLTANYQQVLAPYVAGVENLFRQNRAMRDQLALESYQNRASSEYDLGLAKILEDYKNDSIGRQKALNQLRSDASDDLLKERAKLIRSPWLIQFGEKGTKLSYAEKAMLQRAKDFNKRLSDDNKQFHKDIMESKREYNKILANMSALTAALIKKGMQL